MTRPLVMSIPSPMIGVHLDLKYLMPRKDYLTRWVRRLPELGINTLLLEYEDKFPYKAYPFWRSASAFTPQELRDFLGAARAKLCVIPLVPTLSHLEFALAHDELGDLREGRNILTQINPSNPRARQFVNTLIDEVLEYHAPDELFHIGADEAWHLGHHPDNATQLRERGKEKLWAMYVVPILQRLIAGGKRPIIFDDIFWDRPDLIREIGLPSETILHSWNYGVTPQKLAARPELLRHVDVYRAAGFDVIGAPSLDWGVLVPQFDHCLENTTAWANKVRPSGLLGLINTAWACFLTLLPVESLHTAATARAMQSPGAALETQWHRDFLTQEFGAGDHDIPTALKLLGVNWELDVKLDRPITPVGFGYMEMVLWYGSQANRARHGIFPLDWDEIDFVNLFRRKIELMRTHPEFQQNLDRVRSLDADYSRAWQLLQALTCVATRHRDEAALLASFAGLKSLGARITRFLLDGGGDGELLLREHRKLKGPLVQNLSAFLDPPSLDRAIHMWWEPAHRVLAESLK